MATFGSGRGLTREAQQAPEKTSRKPQPQVLQDDKDIIHALGLDWTPDDTMRYLEKVPRFYLRRLQVNELPVPVGVYCAESETIKQHWEEAWEDLPYADKRIGKTSGRQIQVIHRSRFAHIIRRGESGLFFDEATQELVFARLPRIVRDDAILKAMDEVCKGAARERRGDRRDDPGILTGIGYTGGSRKDRKPTLAGSFLRRNMKPEEKARIHLEESGVATLASNILKPRIPAEVVADYDSAIARRGFRRMDAGLDDGLYSVWSKDRATEWRFRFDEAAPPQGAMSMNYARFTHREDGVNVYGLALTTVSTADPSTGGNFYVAQYGILSVAEGNTATVWRVNDYHGTSLYERIPRQNSGVALFVPTSLIPNSDQPAPHNFTRADLAAVERPPPTKRGAAINSRRTTEGVNEYYVRGETPEEEGAEEGEEHRA
ncbi:hypothetical protein A1O7_04127 [Cladophialophora yegresii CBS 114405]|uniref:Uncharacterized protein n=1 Tax=Cladophialophora yegresii CBS 114405 TaxID=1182544 RepID=W9WNK6_9EURO|nr:uncharacterized protein A1O7_04127 [Cladophialophora yegresii CBS 114405]EXJ59979.1 hypothetical protein A1O7_04127 [Cladophialophora yegresii CBS 114405]